VSITGRYSSASVRLRSTQRLTRAPPPATSASTSASPAVDVSPGVVIASAPWAAPYSTASPTEKPASRVRVGEQAAGRVAAPA
jgi:hypothetical protein